MATRVVLSVEDDDAAFQLLKSAFQETQRDVDLLRVHDGDEALRFLQRSGSYKHAPRPDMVLLNLNLPKKSGVEVLTEIVASESLRSIPVTVFTSSSLHAEKAKSYALGAQDFVTKPTTFTALVDVVKSVCARVACA